MTRHAFSPTDLHQLQRQLSAWRQEQSGRPRLPEAVWTSAAALARTQGLSVVARTLRLDYYKLRRAAAASSSPTAPPAFVELQVAAVSDPGPGLSAVELSDGTGARMTLRVPSDRPTLLALARTFWRRSR